MLLPTTSNRKMRLHEIAYATGLRASELLTLRPIEDRTPDIRLRDGRDRTLETKFSGREDSVCLHVHGKGGLIRRSPNPSDGASRTIVERTVSQNLSSCKTAESTVKPGTESAVVTRGQTFTRVSENFSVGLMVLTAFGIPTLKNEWTNCANKDFMSRSQKKLYLKRSGILDPTSLTHI